MSTAERQSIASKVRQSAGVIGERMGKKPDIMGMMKREEKVGDLNIHILCFLVLIQKIFFFLKGSNNQH